MVNTIDENVKNKIRTYSPIQIETEPLVFDRDDALLAQTKVFLAAILAAPHIDGASTDAALRALRSALRVIKTLPPLDELR